MNYRWLKFASSILVCFCANAHAAGLSLNAGGITFADSTQQGTAYFGPLGNVITVAKSGGDFLYYSNALSSITDASADNPYLVVIGPGVWTQRLSMKPHVDVVGSGEGVTIIRAPGATNITQSPGAVVGADNAALKNLTVDATGSGPVVDGVGIYSNGKSPMIQHVTVKIKGGDNSNMGIKNVNGSTPVIDHVTIVASGASGAYGIYNDGASPVIRNTSVTVDGTGTGNHGIYNTDASSLVMVNVQVDVSGASSGNYGVENLNSSAPDMNNVSIRAAGGTRAVAIRNLLSSSPAMTKVTAVAEDASNSNTGILNGLSSPP